MGYLPMPPVKDYAPPTGRYFTYVWDTKEIPLIQDLGENTVLITPTFDNLRIYGREVGSSYAEDQKMLRNLARNGKINGEWFSTACPEGELGIVPGDECDELTAEEFSTAFKRQWEVEDE
jgi:hypothetical protein